MEPRRSIQDIIPPARSRPVRVPPSDRQIPPVPPGPVKETNESGKGYVYAFIIGVVILISGGVIVAMSTIFHRAYITAVPYTYAVPVSGSFSSAPGDAAIPYEKVSVEETASKTVPATGSEEVEERASGTIVVYNAYSTGPQRLITNTRFESPSGLIYKVHNPITVPGYTTKAGVKVPGSLEVTVYADEPGDSYNVGLVDFTIPGLTKYPDQFKLIYARSKTAMSGGFVGRRAVVDPSVKADAVEELEAELTRSLRSRIADAVPEGSLIFEDTVSISFTNAPDEIDGGNAVVSVSGTAVAPAFNEAALAQEFGRAANVGYDGDLTINNPNDLATLIDPASAPTTGDPLSLSVSGTAELVAAFDLARLVESLAGIQETEISAIRAQYPAFESMNVKVYPFWRRGALPANPDKINVEILRGVDVGD